MKIGVDCKWLFSGPISGKVVLEAYLGELHTYISDSVSIYLILDSRDKQSERKYQSYGYKFIYVRGSIHLVSNIFFQRRVIQSGFDVVLYHNFAPLFSRQEYFLFVHDILYEDFPQFFSRAELLYFKIVKYCCRGASKVFTISETEKKRLIKHSYSVDDNIIVIHNGVDASRFNQGFSEKELQSLKKRLNIEGEYFIYFGRLNDRKNIKRLVLSSSPLFSEKRILCVIVGEKDSLFTEDIDENHVRLTGYLSDYELSLLLRGSISFCYLSLAEGFGLPPLEAMSLGVPTMVSNVTSLPEVCGEASYYVNPYSTQDIENGLRDLLNPSIRENLIEAGYENVKRFSWKYSARKMFTCLNVKEDKNSNHRI